MRNKFKWIIGLLSLTIIFSTLFIYTTKPYEVTGVQGEIVNIKQDPEVYEKNNKTLFTKYFSKTNNPLALVDSKGNIKPNCTWYVWGRVKEATGIELPGYIDQWVTKSVTGGYSKTATYHSIIIWLDSSGHYGYHVAFVDKFDPETGLMTYSECNYGPSTTKYKYNSKTMTQAEYEAYSKKYNGTAAANIRYIPLEPVGKWNSTKTQYTYSGILQKDKWVSISGYWYYFDKNGNKVTSSWISEYGDVLEGPEPGARYVQSNGQALEDTWKSNYYLNSEGFVAADEFITISGLTYYFDPDGKLLSEGWHTISGSVYYIDSNGSYAINRLVEDKVLGSNGKLVKGKFTKIGSYTYYSNATDGTIYKDGWYTISSKQYYFNTKGQRQENKWIDDYYVGDSGARVSSDWVTDDNGTYYVGSDGHKLLGLQTIDSKVYYFNEDGTRHGGFKNVENSSGTTDRYYFNKTTGQAVNGWQTISNKKYYFVKYKATKGPKTIDSKTYVFDTNGVMQTGVTSYDGIYYYCQSNGVCYKNGWKTINSKKYYFKDSQMYVGLNTIDGKEYYFGKTNGQMKTGLLAVLNDEGTRDKYYFTKDGYAINGWKTVSDKRYYFRNHKGVTGLQKIGSYLYYFDDAAVRQVGWKNVTNDEGIVERYYFNKTDGKALNGWQTISSVKYYFKDYKVLKGLQFVDSKLYYFGKSTGKLMYKWQDITNDDGTVDRYYFKSTDGVAYNGFKKISTDYYYFVDYKLQKGIQTVNGKTYFFNLDDGKRITGFVNYDSNTYYFDPETKLMVTGLAKIDKKFYYFDENGAMSFGWRTVDGNNYYFDADGTAHTGYMTMDGNTYYFKKATGQQAIGWYTIGGIKHYFDETGVMQTGYTIVHDDILECDVPYFFNEAGELQKGWIHDTDTYFANNEGVILTGWQSIVDEEGNANWYYFNETGVMQTGWQTIEGEHYFFGENGVYDSTATFE